MLVGLGAQRCGACTEAWRASFPKPGQAKSREGVVLGPGLHCSFPCDPDLLYARPPPGAGTASAGLCGNGWSSSSSPRRLDLRCVRGSAGRARCRVPGGEGRAAFVRPGRPPRGRFISVKTRLYPRRSTNRRHRARSRRRPPARATSHPRRPPSCLPPQTTRPPVPCRPPPPRSTTQPATARSLPTLTNGTFKTGNKKHRTKPYLRD